jgi:hypothetical protein
MTAATMKAMKEEVEMDEDDVCIEVGEGEDVTHERRHTRRGDDDDEGSGLSEEKRRSGRR